MIFSIVFSKKPKTAVSLYFTLKNIRSFVKNGPKLGKESLDRVTCHFKEVLTRKQFE